MNQKFLAKLRNALGIVALLCAMMSAETASAQNFLPNNQAVQVAVATLNNLLGGPAAQVSNGALAGVDKGQLGPKVDVNTVKGALFAEYLRMVVVELKQGQATGVAVNNVYAAISQQGATGARLTTLDAVKQDVIDLLSN